MGSDGKAKSPKEGKWVTACGKYHDSTIISLE